MSNNLNEHPVIVVLTIAAALTGLIWFLTGKDLPTLLRPVTGTSVSSTTVQAGGSSSDVSSASTAESSTADASTTEATANPNKPTQGLTETHTPPRGTGSPSEASPSAALPASTTTETPNSDTNAEIARKANSEHRRPACSDADTGTYGFTNTKSETVFTVVLYYREGSDEGRTITVPPGQTQYVYDFPAGGHNYIVTYRAMVPIMSFPPGAPTMPQDVIYLRGEINVEQCKSGVMEIR
jgi:hypothetical protein